MKTCMKVISGKIALLIVAIIIPLFSLSQAPPACPAATGFPATGQTFVVTRTDDWPDENNSPVPGQLRWAIAQANRCRPMAGGRHIIQFNIPGSGPHTFKPYIMYPRIQSSVTIDGFSQPGSSPGNPMIVIDGEFASAGGVRNVDYTSEGYGTYSRDFSSSADRGRCFEENYDYTLGGSGTAIIWRGLVINNFKAPIPPLVPIGVIHMNTGSGFIVEGCFIGTDYTGTVAIPNDAGITINSPGACTDPPFGDHIIGSTDPNLKNIISGNDRWGINIMKTYNVQILNNYIGLAKDGSPLGNGENGIQMYLWNTNVLVKGNQIEHNRGNGIAVWSANGCPGQYVYSNRFEENNIRYNSLNGMYFVNSGVFDHIIGADASDVGIPNNISYNGGDGIYVGEWESSPGSYAGGAARTVQIRKNRITCNGGKEINLNYGSPNPGNQNIQPPAINTSASTSSTVVGIAPANKLIDVYIMNTGCASCGASGQQGDGYIWLGSTVSDGAGNWSFTGSLSGQIAATATDNTGSATSRNTSEFSTCFFINTLPVKYLTVEAERTNNGVWVQWVTVSEKNSLYFDVQRSEDGIHFMKIGRIHASESSEEVQNYFYTDLEKTDGEIYYRLYQVDLDQTGNYSNVIQLKRTGTISLSVFPNPFDEQLDITSTEQIEMILVTDAVGKEILSYNNVKANSFSFNTSKWIPGVYIVRIGVREKGFTFYKVLKKFN